MRGRWWPLNTRAGGHGALRSLRDAGLAVIGFHRGMLPNIRHRRQKAMIVHRPLRPYRTLGTRGCPDRLDVSESLRRSRPEGLSGGFSERSESQA